MTTTPGLQWTGPALAGLERYFAERLSPERLEGADAAELRVDLRIHLEEDMQRRGLTVVTLEDLRAALAGMGESLPPPSGAEERKPAGDADPAANATASPATLALPAPPALPSPGADSSGPAAAKTVVEGKSITSRAPGQTFSKASAFSKGFGNFWIAFAGLWFPLFIFLFETITRGCAGTVFDPMPDLWHHLLVLVMPVAVWVHLRAEKVREIQGKRSHWARVLRPWLNGMALAVSGFYALCFLPVMPSAVFGILFLGVGLLALGPAFAFTAAIVLWSRTRRLPEPAERRGLKAGFRGMAALILLLELPVILTKGAVSHAANSPENAESRASAVRLVRRFGSERALLEFCYVKPSSRDSLWNSSEVPGAWLARWMGLNGRIGLGTDESHREEARRMYFLVTGIPFNEAEPPSWPQPLVRTMWNRGQASIVDPDRGGTRVAGQIPGLSLAESRIDWHCGQAAGLTWGEWTMSFSNTSSSPEEARCRIALPPGGFVSRVTLWVNDVPQEAAFGPVPQVRAAYQSVAVVERRDPVLVTQPDEGSVLVQAFPVPAGGCLKTRISFTAPAGLDGRVWLPSMVERNFVISAGAKVPLWLQADGGSLELPAALRAHAASEAGAPTLTASLSVEGITGRGLSFLWKNQAAPLVYAEDPFAAPERKLVLRREGEPEVLNPKHIAWVIDSSGRLEPWERSLREAVGKWSAAGRSQAFFLPGDTTAELRSLTEGRLENLEFRGGRDNSAALLAAMEWLRGKPEACLVWLHGPQPGLNVESAGLEQLLERSVSELTLIDVPLIPGENSLTTSFAGRKHLKVIPLRPEDGEGNLSAALDSVLRRRGGSFEFLPAGAALPEGAVKSSDSLARWMAREEAFRLAAAGKPEEAGALAAAHQIVSPWSGAVVLERKEDYARHGLTQSDAAVSQPIPTIPEPSGVLLLLLSAGHFLLLRRRGKRA